MRGMRTATNRRVSRAWSVWRAPCPGCYAQAAHRKGLLWLADAPGTRVRSLLPHQPAAASGSMCGSERWTARLSTTPPTSGRKSADASNLSWARSTWLTASSHWPRTVLRSPAYSRSPLTAALRRELRLALPGLFAGGWRRGLRFAAAQHAPEDVGAKLLAGDHQSLVGLVSGHTARLALDRRAAFSSWVSSTRQL
jgi:hypothetical protein